MAYCSDVQQEVPRDASLDLLEYTCDLDPSRPWCYQRSLLVIEARFVGQNAISRRGRELRLPPDWRVVGFGATRKLEKLLNVCVRELGVWHVVLDYFFGDGEDCSRIEIIFNFSKDRARLRDAITPARLD